MVKMRSLVLQDPACAHLIPLRCMMHGFGLVIGSILGHKWARAVVKQAQRLVTFFRASHKAIKFLRLAAIARKITKLLRTANATRFTSVANMLDSVLGLEQALLAVASEHPDIFRARSTKSKSKQKGAQNAESNGVLVLQTIQSRTFWAKLEPLCQLLDPLTRVTQAVQAADATLASVFRYFLYLGRCVVLFAQQEDVDPEYRAHCIVAFNKRWVEINDPYMQLAFYMHPAYRAFAVTALPLASLYKTVSQLFCVRLAALYCLHCVVCIVLSALCCLHCVVCIVLPALYCLPCIASM
ncbi:TPA: hypothetical protein ACH3X1_016754 [Trebouxia sp. C0004]